MTWVRQFSPLDASSERRVHLDLVSADADRRHELFRRLDGDTRFTLTVQESPPEDDRGVVALDVVGAERHAAELVRRITRHGTGVRLLAVVDDEDDIELARALVLAGAAGIASLRQPSSCLCQAVVDVADGLASVSPALEVDLVRLLQSLPAA